MNKQGDKIVCVKHPYKSVVTAAHCCDGATQMKVVTGDHSYFSIDDTEQKFTASDVIMHPNYNSNTLENDVCMLKFDTNNGLKLSTSEYADFACLNDGNKTTV